MKKEIAILGSTGSIGETTLSILNYEKDFKIELLSTNRNANKLSQNLNNDIWFNFP